MNAGIAENPAVVTIRAVLGDPAPLFSVVPGTMAVPETESVSFLYYALFVQILPTSPKQASERIFFEAVIWQLVLLIVVVAASDSQIPEDIVSTLSADVTAVKSKHFNYCITALLLMHIRPSVESVSV